MIFILQGEKMAQIILDISANTHRNNKQYIKRMIDAINEIDMKKHTIIFKHQLFIKAGDNIQLKHDVFDYAYNYAKELRYETTASVFDKESLEFLLGYNIPFVKLANRRSLDWLIGEVPRKIPIYISCGCKKEYTKYMEKDGLVPMSCVSEYPSDLATYEDLFSDSSLYEAVSDHTSDWSLFKKYNPKIFECHYCLDDSTGLDSGSFARRTNQLKEIL
jgi:sialic acid synthase SpsE